MTEGGSILSFTKILKPQRYFNMSRDYFKSKSIKQGHLELNNIKFHFSFVFLSQLEQRYSTGMHILLKYIFVLVLATEPVSNQRAIISC